MLGASCTGWTCARAFCWRRIFARGFCTDRICAWALYTGRTFRCFRMGRAAARAFSTARAGATWTGCPGPACAGEFSLAAQASNFSTNLRMEPRWFRSEFFRGFQSRSKFDAGRRVASNRRQSLGIGGRLDCRRRRIGLRLKRRAVDQRSLDVRKQRHRFPADKIAIPIAAAAIDTDARLKDFRGQ